ncbi:copper amine oxidase N-terminal domain protein [Paenibacillus algicola]|uniref:Copper amine oxidase N-terminal domain protein n=2 Tax=Paenibacillus algicola TaxID=2565926 RepID=A0A4P8XR25_9BACL|nr:copper amine oxidase N-terminal domain protein [Paenibacillus algicola]
MARRIRRRGGRKKAGVFTLMLLILMAAGVWWTLQKLPNSSYTEPDWRGLKQPILVQGELTGYSASGQGSSLMLPLALVQEYVDPYIYEDEGSETVVFTTASEVLSLSAGTLKGTRNGKEASFEQTVERVDGKLYVPAKLLKELYYTAYYEHSGTGAVLLSRAGDHLELGEAVPAGKQSFAALRQSPSIKSPILQDMPPGERLRIWGEEEQGWLKVQTDQGYTGYVPSDQVKPKGNKIYPQRIHEPSRADLEWRDRSVNLTWEAVYSRNPDPDKLGQLPGVNVVSPTWFEITSEAGDVTSKVSPDYVTWAHKLDKEVWGVLTNSFNPDITTAVLSTYDTRAALITEVIRLSRAHGLDGINIDFENVYTKDKQNLIAFMRELYPRAKELGLIVSIDVTPKSSSEMWSVFLDRRELAHAVDYMMVMSYDEHWAASPEAGSVSSLPWAERTVRRILEEDEVPASKLVLGIPLYTRIWTEEGVEGGGKVTSKAVGMEAVQSLLKEKALTPVYDELTGQNYVQYQEEQSLNKIWIEDEISLKARVELAHQYDLGGIASWSRMLGSSEAWEVLKSIHK